MSMIILLNQCLHPQRLTEGPVLIPPTPHRQPWHY